MRRVRRVVRGWPHFATALTVVGALLPSASGQPAEFYVDDVVGSDSAAGTATAPWLTLQRAANQVMAGDRVIVRPGAYTGFYLDASGLPGSPIEFLAQPGVLINEDNGTTADGINLERASHIIIDGFAVTGMERAGVRTVGVPASFAEFVTIRNVHAYDNGVWGIFTGHVNDLLIENNRTSGSIEEHGIYVSNSGDRPVLRGNVSFDNHGSGIHMNGDVNLGGDGIISNALVSGNRIHNNARSVNGGPLGGGSGINMDGVQNSRIENNLVYDNHASGISLYSIDGAEGSTGNVVVNNTVHQPSNGRWALNIQDGSTDNTVLNNILITEHSDRGAIDVSPDSLPGLASDYNVVVSRFTSDGGDTIDTLAEWQTETGNDVHSKVGSAATLFVDWPAGEYWLKSGAAAIDAGTATMAPGVDIFGLARPQGVTFDAGAIETPGTLPTQPADFDGDGDVDAADLAAWDDGFGAATGAELGDGDADGDHDVDGADFLTWQRELGGNIAVAGVKALPEPAGVLLACVSLAVLCGRRIRTGDVAAH